MISRRGLFKGLFGLGAATALAPVAKFFPAMVMKYRQPGITLLIYDEITDVTKRVLVPTLSDWYFKPRPVFEALTKRKLRSEPVAFAGAEMQVPLQYVQNRCNITPTQEANS